MTVEIKGFPIHTRINSASNVNKQTAAQYDSVTISQTSGAQCGVVGRVTD